MLDRLKSIATGTADLLRVEAEIAIDRARRTSAWVVVAAAAIVFTAVGLAGLLVAATAALALAIGWVAALGSVSALVLVISCGITALAVSKMNAATKRDELPASMIERSAHARRKIAGHEPTGGEMRASSHPDPQDRSRASHGAHSDPFQPKEVVAEMIARNPGIALGGIAAVAALLGPSRTIKLASRGMLLAGLAAKVGKHTGTSSQRHGRRSSVGDREPRTPSDRGSVPARNLAD